MRSDCVFAWIVRRRSTHVEWIHAASSRQVSCGAWQGAEDQVLHDVQAVQTASLFALQYMQQLCRYVPFGLMIKSGNWPSWKFTSGLFVTLVCASYLGCNACCDWLVLAVLVIMFLHKRTDRFQVVGGNGVFCCPPEVDFVCVSMEGGHTWKGSIAIDLQWHSCIMYVICQRTSMAVKSYLCQCIG